MIIVTAAIIEKNGLIMAARRKPGLHMAGFWEFPGGKLEEGEQPQACLQRELLEELGITSHIGELLGESLYHYPDKTVLLLGYFTSHVSGDFRLLDHDEIRWLNPADLKDLDWAPADIPLVEMLMSLKGY